MKEYRTTIKAGFEQGLRPTDVSMRNSGILVSCLGGKVEDKVLKGYTPSLTAGTALIQIGGSAIVIHSGLYPQVFSARSMLFIGTSYSLVLITSTSTTPVTGSYLYNAGASTLKFPWVHAGGDSLIFTCGDVLVYYDDTSWVTVT